MALAFGPKDSWSVSSPMEEFIFLCFLYFGFYLFVFYVWR